MGCNCGKNRVRPAWQPRGRRSEAKPTENGNGARIITPAERAAELAAGRPARAQQPTGR